MGERKLFWGSGSNPCWRPMIILAEKNLKYDGKQISFDKKEHKEKEVTDLNPRGQVPTFKDGDIVVNESAAICFYLEDVYGDQGTKFIPDDKKQKALVLQRTFEVQSNLEPKMMLEFLYYYFRTPEAERDQGLIEKKREALKDEMKKWEKYLGKSGNFIAGQDFTMADVYLFPLIAWAFRLGLPRESFHNITSYYDRCLERESIKSTWPPHWNDNESKLKICAEIK